MDRPEDPMAHDAVSRPAPLLVADHLALDFVNSRAAGSEWLADGVGLLGWLVRSGAIDRGVARRFRGDAAAVDAVAAEARELRQWLRGLVERHAGSALELPDPRELEPLNRLLAQDDSYPQVVMDDGGLGLERQRRWGYPRQLLLPIGEAIADLLVHADFRLIRACEGSGCTLMFLDRTKAHGRRWCSTAVCGNRAKAAAHRARASNRRANAQDRRGV
jgi:predicted RNA-binding Zn ribbon-like protein